MSASSAVSTLPGCLVADGGVVAGCEPVALRQGRAGVLLLHGLTGSPWELRPLAEAFAARGFAVAMPLLAGHGRDVRLLQRCRWPDWQADALAARDWLAAGCDRIHLLGLSMGALLTLRLARMPTPAPLRSVTLLAPALALTPWAEGAVRALAALGSQRMIGKDPPDLRGGLRPPAYPSIPLAAIASLLDLIDTVRADPRPLSVPTLVLHGTADATIPLRRAQARLRPLLGPAAVVRLVPGAPHLLVRSHQAPEVIDRCLGALETLEPYGAGADGAARSRKIDGLQER